MILINISEECKEFNEIVWYEFFMTADSLGAIPERIHIFYQLPTSLTKNIIEAVIEHEIDKFWTKSFFAGHPSDPQIRETQIYRW